MALFAFEQANQSLTLGRGRIGVMHRSAGAILKRGQPFFPAAIEEPFAGLSENITDGLGRSSQVNSRVLG